MTTLFVSEPRYSAKKNSADEESRIPDSIRETVVYESSDSAQRQDSARDPRSDVGQPPPNTALSGS